MASNHAATYTLQEVAKHTSSESCWVVVGGLVIDCTKFLPDHPGGAHAILNVAGRDVSDGFDMFHPPGFISKYAADAVIGVVSSHISGTHEDNVEKGTPPPMMDAALDAAQVAAIASVPDVAVENRVAHLRSMASRARANNGMSKQRAVDNAAQAANAARVAVTAPLADVSLIERVAHLRSVAALSRRTALNVSMYDSNAGVACGLDEDAFVRFSPLLSACQDYAVHERFRFSKSSLDGVHEVMDGDATPHLAAKRRAAPVVRAFAAQLHASMAARDDWCAFADDVYGSLLPDKAVLAQAFYEVYGIVIAESVRNSMISICKELDMFPPIARPNGIDDNDCSWESSAPFLATAQRLWNDQTKRLRSKTAALTRRRAVTAHFIVDVADEMGVPLPPMPEAYSAMVDDFHQLAYEWAAAKEGAQEEVLPSARAESVAQLGAQQEGASEFLNVGKRMKTMVGDFRQLANTWAPAQESAQQEELPSARSESEAEAARPWELFQKPFLQRFWGGA